MSQASCVLRGVIALSFCLAAVPAAQSKTWGSRVTTFADCLPESSSVAQPPSPLKTCSTADASAYAEASFTSLKLAISTTAAAPVGHYFAETIIDDSVLVTPDDAALLGTKGFVRFTAAVDGVIAGPQASFSMVVYEGVYDATYNAYSLNLVRITNDRTGRPVTNAVFQVVGNATVDAHVWWDLPVVYGEGSSYRVDLTTTATGPNASADFSNTFRLTAVQALDANRQAVAASHSAGSGAQLPVTAVPEPQAMLLMLAGLCGLGLAHRRRSCA